MTARYDRFRNLSNNIVKDGSGTEYFVTKVNPKNLELISMVDGHPLTSPHGLVKFVRETTMGDLHRRFDLEDKWAVNPENLDPKPANPRGLPKIGLGMRVRVLEQLGDFPRDVDYVVIGINATTFNVVPLGGFGNGTKYASVSRECLTIIEEPAK